MCIRDRQYPTEERFGGKVQAQSAYIVNTDTNIIVYDKDLSLIHI